MRDINNAQLYHILYNALPPLASFGFSFIVIGVFWVAHHRIFTFVEIPNRTLLWLNILYLLFIAVVPLSAGILSENPLLPTAIFIYAATLFIIAIMHLVLLRYILSESRVKHEALTPSTYKTAARIAIVGPICYLLAAILSFVSVYLSFFLIISALIFYIFFSGKNKVEDKMINIAVDKK